MREVREPNGTFSLALISLALYIFLILVLFCIPLHLNDLLWSEGN